MPAAEKVNGRLATFSAKGPTLRRILRELLQSYGKLCGVAWRMKYRTGLGDFGRAARAAHDDRPAARHRLGNDQSKGLRLDAGVNDDVERSKGGRDIIGAPRETDGIGQAMRSGKLAQLVH